VKKGRVRRRRWVVGLSDYSAVIGSIKLGSLFLTFPTRALTGQHVIASDG
jgi:hypothetical protein